MQTDAIIAPVLAAPAKRTDFLSDRDFSEALVSASRDGILAFDKECRFTIWNPAMETISGLSAEAVLGRYAFDVFPFLKQIGEDRYFFAALEGETVSSKERSYNVPETQREGFFEATYSPLRNGFGQIVGGLGVVRDISEQKEHETKIRQLNQQLEQRLAEREEAKKSQARAQLFKAELSSLSHELNSAGTPREAATAIFETADELFSWDACTLHLFSQNAASVRTVLNIDTIDGKRREINTENDGKLTPRMRKVLQDGAQLILRKESSTTDSMNFGDTGHMSASIMVVPIREAKKTLGMLSVQSYAPNAYDSEKLRTLQTLANYCGGALERIRATEQLLLRENQLRIITDSLPVLISFVDKDHRYRFNNKAYESWFGLSPESLFGKSLDEVLSVENLEELRPYIEQALKGETISFERWVPHKSLGPRYTQALYVPVLSDSKVEGFIHLSTDITERKQTEDRLQLLSEGTKILSSTLHPNEMLKKLASLSVPTLADYCFFDVVEDSRITRAACEHVHGEKKSWFFKNVKYLPTKDCDEHPVIKVIRSRKPQLITDVTDEWLRRIATSREHLQFMRNLNCCSTMTLPVIFGERILGALTFCFAESKRRHSEADCKLGEEIARRVAIALHNAELFESIKNEHAKAQTSEAYFRDLAEAIPHMVWTTTADGTFEFCNRRWCEYTGQSREGSDGLGWLNAVHPNDMERVSDAWKTSLSKGELYQVEYPLRAADGTYRWHLDRALPLRDKDGTIVKWFGTCTDVHEKIHAEGMVGKMNHELERRVSERTVALKEINDQMESFCYSVSHDLRAPLRAMRALTQVLLDDYAPQLDHAGQDFLNRVGHAAERMDRLIQDLLDYSRLGRMQITLEPINLESSVESVLVDLRLEIRARKAVVEVKKPMPQVIAHETVLEQILQNLIGNALKFVDSGKTPEIKIWAEKVGASSRYTKSAGAAIEEPSEMVRIYVEDTGIGIPPEYHKRIFNVFERLHGTEDFPGTGIGLAIVQKGAERMKGSVGLESEPGKGSCFWVELPAA